MPRNGHTSLSLWYTERASFFSHKIATLILAGIEQIIVGIGNRDDVVAGLAVWWDATVVVDGLRACVVGSDGVGNGVLAPAGKVVELVAKVDGAAEDVAKRIIRVNADGACRARHELHEADRADRAHGIEVEMALGLHHGGDEIWIDAIEARSIEDGIGNPVALDGVAIVGTDIVIDDRVRVGRFADRWSKEAESKRNSQEKM